MPVKQQTQQRTTNEYKRIEHHISATQQIELNIILATNEYKNENKGVAQVVRAPLLQP